MGFILIRRSLLSPVQVPPPYAGPPAPPRLISIATTDLVTSMDKKQIAKIQPQKAPYVTPRMRTLRVSLSFASPATTLHDIFDLTRPQTLEPDKPEIPRSKRGAGNV